MPIRKYFRWLPLSSQLRLIDKRDRARTLSESIKDGIRFASLAGPTDQAGMLAQSGINLECQLTKDYHRVEKALAMPAPRRPFGSELRRRLDFHMNRVHEIDVTARQAVEGSVANALAALEEWNSGGRISEEVAPLGALDGKSPDSRELAAFFQSRHSVRNFDEAREVSREDLESAIQMASSTPSVCNRQAARVHFFKDRNQIERILKIQAGARGFDDVVPCLAIVTVESRLFAGSFERNQPWIDGALYAMTLVWGLQAVRLGTCMLNWSRNHADTALLRRAADLPHSENVICLIAVGYPASGHRVARSVRREMGDVVSFH
jgi:nitroreductase